MQYMYAWILAGKNSTEGPSDWACRAEDQSRGQKRVRLIWVVQRDSLGRLESCLSVHALPIPMSLALPRLVCACPWIRSAMINARPRDPRAPSSPSPELQLLRHEAPGILCSRAYHHQVPFLFLTVPTALVSTAGMSSRCSSPTWYTQARNIFSRPSLPSGTENFATVDSLSSFLTGVPSFLTAIV